MSIPISLLISMYFQQDSNGNTPLHSMALKEEKRWDEVICKTFNILIDNNEIEKYELIENIKNVDGETIESLINKSKHKNAQIYTKYFKMKYLSAFSDKLDEFLEKNKELKEYKDLKPVDVYLRLFPSNVDI